MLEWWSEVDSLWFMPSTEQVEVPTCMMQSWVRCLLLGAWLRDMTWNFGLFPAEWRMILLQTTLQQVYIIISM